MTKQIQTAHRVSGLSQYAVCKQTGLSKSLVSELLSGNNHNPTISTLSQLANCYQTIFAIGYVTKPKK